MPFGAAGAGPITSSVHCCAALSTTASCRSSLVGQWAKSRDLLTWSSVAKSARDSPSNPLTDVRWYLRADGQWDTLGRASRVALTSAIDERARSAFHAPDRVIVDRVGG